MGGESKSVKKRNAAAAEKAKAEMEAQLKSQLEKSVDEYRTYQKDVGKNYESRNVLLTQKEENEVVKKELSLLEEDGVVFKLVGPVLVKQDRSGAQENVEKRLEYIDGEITRADKVVVELETKMENIKTEIGKIQAKARGEDEEESKGEDDGEDA